MQQAFFASDGFDYVYGGTASPKTFTVGFGPNDTFELRIRNPRGLRAMWIAEPVDSATEAVSETVLPDQSVTASMLTLPAHSTNENQISAPVAPTTTNKSPIVFSGKGEPRKSKPSAIRGDIEELALLTWRRSADAKWAAVIHWKVHLFVLDTRTRGPKDSVIFSLEFECLPGPLPPMKLELVDESKQTELRKQHELRTAGPRNLVVNYGFMIPVLLVFGLFMPLDTFSAEAGRIWMGFVWGLFGMWIKQKFDLLTEKNA